MSIPIPIFEIAEGPDTLLLYYNPESILTLAETIKDARSMGLSDPACEKLCTELRGRLTLPATA
jgi:hypothetical protein